jgi:hypothetical protein
LGIQLSGSFRIAEVNYRESVEYGNGMDEYGCKVCRVLDERNMQRYGSQLVERWQDDRPQRMGYRKLATWLNVTILRREMDRAGFSTLGNEAISKYERLRGDDETVAAEVRNDLRTAGVPIDDLESYFVSYGVVRTHLKECLGEDREFESRDWESDAIEIACDHAGEKIGEAVGGLQRKGKLDAVGEITIHVDVELECETTHARVPVDRAIRRGYVSRPDDKGSDIDGGADTP